MFSKKKILLFVKLLIVFVFNAHTYSDSLNGFNSSFVGKSSSSKPLIYENPLQIVEGNYEAINCWQKIDGGEQFSDYKVIKSTDSLDSYWQFFKEKHVDLYKPEIDFTKNLLVVIQSGECNIKFKFRVKIDKEDKLVKFAVSNFPVEPLNTIRFSKSPIFMFEIAAPPESSKIKVDFNIDHRSTWSQPK